MMILTVIVGQTPAAETIKPEKYIVSKTAIIINFECGKFFI